VDLLRRLSVGAAEALGVIPRLAGRLEPLAAFYPKAAHAIAVDCLERKIFAVKVFSEMCVRSGLAVLVELDVQEEHYFANWNSPADLQLPGDGPALYSKPRATR
jgi:molybdopterin-guanine dinucleotide biosynthesis protein A